MVEFAMLAPVFFLILTIILDFGRAVFVYAEISNAAAAGARQAILAYNQMSNTAAPACNTASVDPCQVPGVLPAMSAAGGTLVTYTYVDSTSQSSPPNFADGSTVSYTAGASASDPGTITISNPQANRAYVFIYEVGTNLSPDPYWPCPSCGADIRASGFHKVVVEVAYAYSPWEGLLIPFMPNHGILMLTVTDANRMEY